VYSIASHALVLAIAGGSVFALANAVNVILSKMIPANPTAKAVLKRFFFIVAPPDFLIYLRKLLLDFRGIFAYYTPNYIIPHISWFVKAFSSFF